VLSVDTTTSHMYLLRFIASLIHGMANVVRGLQRITTVCARPLGAMTNILVVGMWIINFVIQFKAKIWHYPTLKKIK